MKTQLNYNVHKAINFRGWRKGVANDFLTTFKGRKYWTTKPEMDYPPNTYGIYSDHYGKMHSQYPRH